MSQQKVEHKKALKANRKKLNRQHKIQTAVITICIIIVAVAVIGWVGYSARSKMIASKESEAPAKTEVNIGAITDYMSSVNEE